MNVLIVDDDRSVQRVLAEALTKQGFVVTVERDGEWAVQTFEKKNYDVVLLDLLLPALSGYEVARKLRAMPKGKRVPIIMISGVYKNPVHQREAVETHGAFALLEKPLDLKVLFGTLRDALGDKYPRPAPPKPPPPPVEEDDDDRTGEFYADDAQREEAAEVERHIPAPPPSPVTAKSPALNVPPLKTEPKRKSPLAPKPPSKKLAPPPPPVDDDDEPTQHAPPQFELPPSEPTPRPSDKLEMPWSKLTEKPFAELVAAANRSHFDGALRLRRGTVKKIVYFRNGTPELVKSNLLVECLGRVLVKEKLISEAECEESLRRMKQSKRMQGTVLIEMGCISPHNLQHALVLQLQHKIYDAFSWDDGEYQFVPNAPLPAEPLSIGMTAAQLIHEGVKRTYDERRLFKTFSGHDHEYVYPAEDPLYALQEAGLGAEEKELLQLADGHKTLATLRALEMLPAFETDRFFFAMKCAQMVSFKTVQGDGKARVNYADMAAGDKPVAAPPKLPPPWPPMPPPLPQKKPPEPSLDLPWNDAKLAAPIAHVPPQSSAPPPPPPAPKPAPPPKAPEPVMAKSAGSLLPELSEVVSLPRVSGQEGQRREKLAQKFSAMRKLDYFEILGVQQSATREDIKRAYFALAKEYHPDRHFSSASAETRALAQQIYDLISTAHDTLTDQAERKRYVDELKAGEKRPDDADVGRILAAEGKFQRGEELMRQRHYGDAHKHFREAIGLYPEEGEFHAWEGWAHFQANPNASEDAMRSIERAVSLNPRLDKSYLFLGYIYKASGRPDRAERQFEKAIQCNPDCTEALRELRLLGKQKR
ncbi:MAG: response regulator [Archangium sp.]